MKQRGVHSGVGSSPCKDFLHPARPVRNSYIPSEINTLKFTLLITHEAWTYVENNAGFTSDVCSVSSLQFYRCAYG
jgi:hypothetical protein